MASALVFRTSVPGFSPGRAIQFPRRRFPSPGHPCGPPAPVFSTGIQDQGCHPRYLQRFRRSLSTSPFPARSSPARTSPPAFRPAARCPEGYSLVPRRALRLHPGIEVSLAFSLDPAPHGFRFGIRAIPAVPTRVVSFELRVLPRRLESACASYPAYSPCGSIRLALRHFLLDLPRARRSLSTLAGFQLRSRGPAVFPPSSLPAHFYMCRSSAGSSRFLPNSRPTASIRLFGTHYLRRELLPTFRISRNPLNSYKFCSYFRQDFSFLSFQRLRDFSYFDALRFSKMRLTLASSPGPVQETRINIGSDALPLQNRSIMF